MDDSPLTPEDGGSLRGVRAVLVDDIILDHIFTRLDVQDIVNLRQVSSQYRRLSHESIAWKRIIDRAEHVLPPVPPTERYSFANLTSIEAERLLTRAVSVPKRWDRPIQVCLRRWDIYASRTVLDMALLPGGQYMVASVTDRSKTRYSIEVFTSDFCYSMGCPIARVETRTRAFDLRVRYMAVRGEQGIVIAYVRREYRRESHAKRFDINDFEPDSERHASMIKYECVVVHIPLKWLEPLCDNTASGSPPQYRTIAMTQPHPFLLLTEIVSRSRISNPVMYEDAHGVPFIAVLKNTDRILYKNLNGGLGCTMTCDPNPDYAALPHAILAFTLLPSQNQILVVRRAGANPPSARLDGTVYHGPYYFAELYPLMYAPNESIVLHAESRSAPVDSAGNFWRKVWITDPPLLSSSSSNPSIHGRLAARLWEEPPPPVTLFSQTAQSLGIIYDLLIPTCTSSADSTESSSAEPPTYRYTLSPDAQLLVPPEAPPDSDGLVDAYEHLVFPAIRRPVIFTIPCERAHGPEGGLEIKMVGGVWDERLLGKDLTTGEDEAGPAPAANGHGPAAAADEDDGGSTADSTSNGERKASACTFALDPEHLVDVSAVAWDETIGRLCVAYAKRTRIAVFDFAAGAVFPPSFQKPIRISEGHVL